MVDKLLLSVREAADTLSVSRSRLYEMLAAEELPSVQVGRLRRIALADLLAYVERLREEAGRSEERKGVML